MKRILCLLFVFCMVFSLSFAESSPVGRWTVSSNYSTMEDNYMFAKTDFFFFSDGSVYRVSITKKRLENDLSIAYDNGIWIGSASDLSIRVGKDVFKAYIDENDFLIVIVSDESSVKFMRIMDPEAIV